jgi:hypothetical protein
MRGSLRLLLSLPLFLVAGCLGNSNPADTSGPLVAISNPADGATVGSNVSIDVQAVDDVGVDLVRVLVDADTLAVMYSPPFHVTWNTRSLANNSTHTIRAEAFDVAKNWSAVTISVTVFNQPQ